MENQHKSPLELAKKLHQQSVWEEAVTVAREGRSSRPIVVELDPTSHCDLGCPECISDQVLHGDAFSSARLIELAHELVELPVRAVILIGGGEPLLHPAISRVIEILK